MKTLALLSVVALAACSPSPAPAPSPSPSPSQPAQALPPGPTTKALEPSQNVQALVGRLQHEAAHRPQVPLPAERVLAALAITRPKQYVGMTMKASYCAGGTTAAQVTIAVCEYPTADAANAGKAHMDALFAKAVPHAKRTVHRTTVVTVTPPLASNGAQRADIVERAFSTLRSL